MIFIGIDPGLNGGIAFVPDDGSSVGEPGIKLFKTPVIAGKEYDIQGMKDILLYKTKSLTIGLVIIENQISMPGQGLTSTLQTGKGFGIWLGLLGALEIPYQIVSARQWQIKMFTGCKGSLDTKQKSEVVAKRLFPRADFRKSERAVKADDGLTDAACMAEYGRRLHSGKSSQVSGISCEPNPRNKEICMKCGGHIPSAEPNNCAQKSFL